MVASSSPPAAAAEDDDAGGQTATRSATLMTAARGPAPGDDYNDGYQLSSNMC